MISPISFHLQL